MAYWQHLASDILGNIAPNNGFLSTGDLSSRRFPGIHFRAMCIWILNKLKMWTLCLFEIYIYVITSTYQSGQWVKIVGLRNEPDCKIHKPYAYFMKMEHNPNLADVLLSHTVLPDISVRWLTHWSRDKMAAISQTTFSKVFSWWKMY